MQDGALLNRYWDDEDTPRTESYLDDVLTASEAEDRPAEEVYRDRRAGAASGWDFSSRWFDNPLELSSIRTTSLLPVDLNALMYHLEHTLANACVLAGEKEAASRTVSLRKPVKRRLITIYGMIAKGITRTMTGSRISCAIR